MSQKFALIIGNNEHNDTLLRQLKTPPVDVDSFAKVLRDPTIADFDVKTVVNHSHYEIRLAIADFFADKKPDDLLLLYFSGHGVLDDRGRLYLATKDTQYSRLRATSLEAGFLTDEMDNCRSRRQILILDCCHSGAFVRGTKGETKVITQTTFEGNGYGRAVLTASDSTQYALEGDQVIEQSKLSLFTHFLIEGLAEGQADLNKDGTITLDEWYEYAFKNIISQTPQQTPRKWVYNQQGELKIALNPFQMLSSQKQVHQPPIFNDTKNKIRVGILEDHQAVVDGYIYRLAKESDIEVVFTLAYGEELESALADHKPIHVLLLEVQLRTSPDNNNNYPVLHAISKLLQQYPELNVLVITAHEERGVIRSVMDAGASGYILKNDQVTFRDIASVIRTVAGGGIYFSQWAHQQYSSFLVADSILTTRQLEALSLCSDSPNSTTSELAQRMNIANSTLRNLLSGVYLKLDVNNRAAAIAKARRMGLIASDGNKLGNNDDFPANSDKQ